MGTSHAYDSLKSGMPLRSSRFSSRALGVSLLGFGLLGLALAQTSSPQGPEYTRYREGREKLQRAQSAFNATVVNGNWTPDGVAYTFRQGGELKAWSKETRKIESYTAGSGSTGQGGGNRRPTPARGRQFTSVESANGEYKAQYENGNIELLFLKAAGVKQERVTTDGDLSKRIKYGTGSWVYGEELDQREAMWFSPDSTKLAFYRFDESKVIDYHLTVDEAKIQNKLYTEAYPKAGAPNPEVGLLIYDVATKKTVTVDTRLGAKDNDDLGHYVYAIRWVQGNEKTTGKLLFFRLNRLQNVMQVCLADPNTGKSSVILEETNPNGWVDSGADTVLFESIEDTENPGFFVLSERTGFKNIYRYDANGKLLATLTKHPFEVQGIERIDYARKQVWYTARSGKNPLWIQLHRVNFDGSDDVRLTDPNVGHRIQMDPKGEMFVDHAEALDVPTVSTLRDATGKEVAKLGAADFSPFVKEGFQLTKRFECLAADGKTTISGYYRVPSNFDPKQKYPVLVSVYGGPESGTGRERFVTPDDMAEYGFVTVWIDGRGTTGRGRDFRQSVYKKLGVVEIDDQAAAVKYLTGKFPFMNKDRVGIHGTSYGGYSSIMAILRYPDVFHAAAASSSVTSWMNYDSIYTERYMATPQVNARGYEEGSAMTYASQLKGRLILFYGTADDNVHPTNTHQLIVALDRAQKPYELQVGVDQGHAGLPRNKTVAFFIDALMRGNLPK